MSVSSLAWNFEEVRWQKAAVWARVLEGHVVLTQRGEIQMQGQEWSSAQVCDVESVVRVADVVVPGARSPMGNRRTRVRGVCAGGSGGRCVRVGGCTRGSWQILSGRVGVLEAVSVLAVVCASFCE